MTAMQREVARIGRLIGLVDMAIGVDEGIIRDAEGATKFVTVQVGGGHDEAECRRVAYAVAESPLVKTALFASDPNWGRILAAVGRAGVAALDVMRVELGRGRAGAQIWTSDLSHDYVRINAEYRS